MAKPMIVNICHLYPDLMDTYGDRGNILAIIYRCKKRGINVNIKTSTVGEKLTGQSDIYFFGGGQDQAQDIVSRDLAKKGSFLKNEVDNNSVVISICGGYQLLQNYFKTSDGKSIKGIGLFNAYTRGSETRMMNNLLIEVNPKIQKEIDHVYPTTQLPNLPHRRAGYSNTLVGFENHSGKTYLEEGTMPLGTVVKGFGNNGQDKLEGAVYKYAFGTYLHGSLLPKNPHFADFLITKALENNYGSVNLKPLDDWLEWSAHEQAIKRIS